MSEKRIGFIGGHSNIKVGARGVNGKKEEELCRVLADKCVNLATNIYYLSAYTDKISQHSGGGEEDFIINNKLDYFVSIHLNCSNDKRANGTEILVSTREKTTGIEEKMLNRICDEIGFKNRGIKRRQTGGEWLPNKYKDINDYYGILKYPKAKGISGAILETCFISNEEDMKKFEANIDKIAKIIVECIAEGFKIEKRPNTQETIQKPSEELTGCEKMYRTVIFSGSYEGAVKIKNEAIAKGFKDTFIIEK